MASSVIRGTPEIYTGNSRNKRQKNHKNEKKKENITFSKFSRISFAAEKSSYRICL